jgi:hypothetical protein
VLKHLRYFDTHVERLYTQLASVGITRATAAMLIVLFGGTAGNAGFHIADTTPTCNVHSFARAGGW